MKESSENPNQIITHCCTTYSVTSMSRGLVPSGTSVVKDHELSREVTKDECGRRKAKDQIFGTSKRARQRSFDLEDETILALCFRPPDFSLLPS